MDRNPSSPKKSVVIVALVLGGVSGIVDLLARSAQIAPILIVIFSFLLSLTYPRKAWLWALLVGMGVPLANTLALELGYGDVRRPESIYLTYLAFVPALIGAYSAAMLRRHAARHELKQEQGKIRHGPPGR
ncbi:MAG: hypothetical protein O7I93_03905 [Gemmatimonadetes bacterium]|nr:hypothetical protein [Gemmatimonadota bacterium]